MRTVATAALGTIAATLFAGSAHAQAQNQTQTAADYDHYAAIIAAPDRTEADKKNDARRDAVRLLDFTGVQPGWTVIDMAADAGYSTELMARAVVPGGKVYGQNAPDSPPRVTDAWAARMQHPAMKDVVADTRPFDDPVPPGEDGKVDLISFFFGYHDTTYMKVDRAKMDKAMFDALKPGGILVVADYAALPGAPVDTGHTFHRLDENIEKTEIQAAGFKLVDEGFFLRNPNDPHNMPIFKPQIPIDIFVLKFQKPS
jgi:predicted methyltransferase